MSSLEIYVKLTIIYETSKEIYKLLSEIYSILVSNTFLRNVVDIGFNDDNINNLFKNNSNRVYNLINDNLGKQIMDISQNNIYIDLINTKFEFDNNLYLMSDDDIPCYKFYANSGKLTKNLKDFEIIQNKCASHILELKKSILDILIL